MEAAGSYKTIIEKLAFEAPVTIYRLSKETGHSTSTIHAAIHKLMKENFVKRIEDGYAFTFPGLLRYFEHLGFSPSTIDEIIKKYASLYNYAIFSEWENLKKEWFGSTIYTILRNAALSAMRQPYSPIISRSQESKAEPVDPKEHGEAGWRNNFTWFFLKEIESQDRNLKLATGILRGEGFEPLFTIEGNRMHVEPLAYRPIKNTVIYKLMKEILEERRFQCHFHLAEIKKLEKLFIS